MADRIADNVTRKHSANAQYIETAGKSRGPGELIWRAPNGQNAESVRYVEHLPGVIDTQLARWSLSPSEKAVALLLLKGLSLKEIAQLRNTAEKTVRSQSVTVYSKSGLAGRSELAAFFLEDLLVSQSRSQS